MHSLILFVIYFSVVLFMLWWPQLCVAVSFDNNCNVTVLSIDWKLKGVEISLERGSKRSAQPIDLQISLNMDN